MKLFISWSGEHSLLMAQNLHEWLPNVIQTVTPWVSSRDLTSGKWDAQLCEQLKSADAVIVVLTPRNYSSVWMAFESGYIAAKNDNIIPLLMGMKPNNLPVNHPFQHYRAMMLDEKGVTAFSTSKSY